MLAMSFALALASGFDGEALTTHLDQSAAHDRWFGSVALSKDGALVYAHAAGSLDGSASLGTESRFRVGSITKTFTAAVVLKLAEEGRLSLEDPLATWFPSIPNAADITVEQLLDHHSGIRSFTDVPEYPEWSQQPVDRAALLARMEALAPAFAPGERGEYSNSNYVLLGWIVEDLEGRPLSEVFETRLFTPLGLSHTTLGDRAGDAASMVWDGSAWTVGSLTDDSVPGGAGALVSTPTDLCTFAHALFSGRVVNEASLATMMRRDDDFGHGLFQFPFHSRRAWGHTGGIDAFSAMLGYFPEDDTCLALASNGAVASTNDMAIAALSLWYDEPWSPPPYEAADVDEQALAALAGTYSSDALPLDIEISVRNGALWAQATGQSAFPLTPERDDVFVFDAAGIRVVFGEPGAFTLHQAGGTYAYERR